MMIDLHAKLNGTANLYAMDHRGTGRSTMLDCVATQAQTSGSPKGRNFDPNEVAACAKSLSFKYTDFTGFSVTSAATDLATFLSEYTNGASTIVYGVDYGTMLVERLMHLAPPKVVGYVMDGISSTPGVFADKFEYLSEWEVNFGAVGDQFLAFCDQHSLCRSHFEKKNVSATLDDVLTQFDKDPNSTCASLVSTKTSTWSDAKPSFQLRKALGTILNSPKKRTLIAPIIYRLNRCSPEDVDAISNFFDVLNSDLTYPTQSEAYNSNLLYYLIVFSEMWELPGPSVDEMNARFAGTKLSDGTIYELAPVYCAFSKEKSSWCEELGLGNYDANSIMYKRDQYWNTSATIPSQASVLLLSSKLDTKTPHKFAESMLDVLKGDNKELVTFNSTVHGAVAWSFPVDNVYTGGTCGMNVLASYVSNKGDLQKLDTTCVDEMPPLNLTTPIDYQYIYLSTDDAYDGAFNSSLQTIYN